MDNYVDERDFKLLEQDAYTFFVLRKIIKYPCRVILTDHERLIVCHTGNPFPTWVWTADDATDEEKEKAYKLAMENSPAEEGHTYNIKYSLAEYFMKRAAEDGKNLKITTNMFAYDCPEPKAPESEIDGELHQCTEEDIDMLVEFMDMFHNTVGIDKQSLDVYRENAKEGVKFGSLYFWKNAEGKPVAGCNWRPNDYMASVGLVYTREEERRKHYAEHLVYNVTMIAKEAGFLPMLYTDADYAASNACYEKIGYIRRGELCTVGI